MITHTSNSSSCGGGHYNVCLKKVLQSGAKKDPGALGFNIHSLFPPPLVGRPRTIRKAQELTMREVKQGKKATLLKVLREGVASSIVPL
jgi:hypothetical protein